MRLVLLGFGNVGQGFTEILDQHGDWLREARGLAAHIVGVATRSRGVLYQPDGLTPRALLEALQHGSLDAYPDAPGLVRDWDVWRLLREAEADVLLEATPSNLETAQPALSYVQTAFERGWHVVSANKGPVMVAYRHCQQWAQAAGRAFRFEATVMAGTPALMLAREALAGCHIIELTGILNGTSNYMLTRMHAGLTYDLALQEAQALGYAESDPAADVEGWDAAAKVRILAASLWDVDPQNYPLSVQGITDLTPQTIQKAQNAHARLKLIASATPERGKVHVAELALNHPLASVDGATNAITYATQPLGQVTLVGPGAGRQETGYALLADLLAIQRAKTP